MLKDVSDALGINPSAITAPIGRMEDAGLVRREFSDNDGRVAHIYPTSHGDDAHSQGCGPRSATESTRSKPIVGPHIGAPCPSSSAARKKPRPRFASEGRGFPNVRRC